MKNIYSVLITFLFMIIFSVKGFSQTCTLPEGRIAESPIFVYDAGADSMIITVPVSNAGSSAFASPFRITVYKDNVGNAQRYTYNYNSAIATGETVDITFGIKDFKAGWTPFDNLIIRINDSGNGYNNQLVCDSVHRDYERVQLIASDDRMLVFNNSTDNQFWVAINDILPSSYVSLTVNLLSAPAYTGNATVSGSTIFYTPAAGKSFDTLRYRIHCGNAEYADTATIYVKIMNQPENVGDAECFVNPVPLPWSISEYHSFTGVHSMSTPLVADLDGDGMPEVITPKIGTVGDAFNSNGFIVGDVIAKTQQTISTVQFATHGQSIAIANVNADPSVDKDAYIFLLGTDYKVYCYNGRTGALVTSWGSSGSVDPQNALGAADKRRYIIQLADINADGISELIVGPYIYNARTGALLLAGTFQTGGTGFGSPHALMENYWGRYRMPAVGDIDYDGQLEIVAGNTIYKPVITNVNNNTGNTWSILSTAVSNANIQYPDGQTVLVDFDRDGDLDVAVVGCEIRNNTNDYEPYHVQFYVWDGQTPNIISYAPVLPNRTHATIPYAGDLNGDGFVDFAFAESHNGLGLVSYHYDPSQPGNIKRGLNKTEFAETSGFTMFDFNQDGKSEIVYRNTTQFFIVDGTTLNPITPITTMYSGTVAEYPIVADVDNDGSAEIILTHANKQWASPYDATGTMTVYKSGSNDAKWAPARKVWNQWHFNTTLINDNMTVQRYPVNPATIFPGPDGQLGTSDDIQPYNAFLQQQTTLSKNGTPYWESADYAIEGIPNTIYHALGDSLVISFCVTNYGDVQGTAPFHVSVYKNTRQTGNAVATKSYSNIPAPGQTICYSIKINNVLALGSLINSLHLWLNDSGTGTSANPECDYTNGVVIYDVTGTVAAQNDYASVFVCNEVSIPILANDTYSGTTFEILNTPKYGTIVQSGGVLKYTNDGGTSGLPCEQTGNRTDTIRYKIKSIVSEAEAYAIVKIYNEPAMILEDACSASPKIVLSNTYDGFTYDWEYSPDGASGWTFLATDSGSTELKNITQAGFYRFTINYDNGKTYQLPKGIEVVVNLTTQLPGGTVWYDLSFNTVTINWQ
jgi:hypothetical protein